MDSPSLLSRESTTLSFSNPQKGHFIVGTDCIVPDSSSCAYFKNAHKTPGLKPKNLSRTYFAGSKEPAPRTKVPGFHRNPGVPPSPGLLPADFLKHVLVIVTK